MYAFESTPQRGLVHVLTAACFVAALLLFGISGMRGVSFPLLYQLSGIILMVVGVYFLTRYILKRYRYEICQSSICDAEGRPLLDLVITETSGRRQVVVARVALRDITRVEDIDKGADRALAKERKAQLSQGKDGERLVVFPYVNTPFLTRVCYICVPEERSVLIIPSDATMIDMLKRSMEDTIPHIDEFL